MIALSNLLYNLFLAGKYAFILNTTLTQTIQPCSSLGGSVG
jgi:hypothetical protein